MKTLLVLIALMFPTIAIADADDFIGCLELNGAQADCSAELEHNYDLPMCEAGESSDDCESE